MSHVGEVEKVGSPLSIEQSFWCINVLEHPFVTKIKSLTVEICLTMRYFSLFFTLFKVRQQLDMVIIRIHYVKHV